jgi:hypothetical protein
MLSERFEAMAEPCTGIDHLGHDRLASARRPASGNRRGNCQRVEKICEQPSQATEEWAPAHRSSAIAHSEDYRPKTNAGLPAP